MMREVSIHLLLSDKDADELEADIEFHKQRDATDGHRDGGLVMVCSEWIVAVGSVPARAQPADSE